MLGSLLPSEIIVNCLCVGAGGFVGAVARYLLGLVIPTHASGFPVGTFVVNVAGAFVIALAFTLFMRMMGFDNRLLLFLTTGLCGGFTTFSTFTWESRRYRRGGRLPGGDVRRVPRRGVCRPGGCRPRGAGLRCVVGRARGRRRLRSAG